jgi:hypothetical protein
MTEHETIHEWCARHAAWYPSKSHTAELLAHLEYAREADDRLTRALETSEEMTATKSDAA